MDRIKDVVDAINSVKYRLHRAIIEHDSRLASQLAGDLLALENCLVNECEQELSKEKKSS